MNLSVIVSHFNAHEPLYALLRSFESQTLPAHMFEVIVVDAGSKPYDRDKIKSFTHRYGYRVVEAGAAPPPVLRQTGMAAAKNEYILLMDLDMMPTVDLLKQHLELQQERRRKPAVVLGGVGLPKKAQPTVFQRFLATQHYATMFQPPDALRAPLVAGNCSFSRALFEETGGYSEDFVASCGADLDLGYRMQQAGADFVYRASAAVNQLPPADLAAVCAKRTAQGEAAVQLAAAHEPLASALYVDVVQGAVATPDDAQKAIQRAMRGSSGLDRLVLRLCGNSAGMAEFTAPRYRRVLDAHYVQGIRNRLG